MMLSSSVNLGYNGTNNPNQFGFDGSSSDLKKGQCIIQIIMMDIIKLIIQELSEDKKNNIKVKVLQMSSNNMNNHLNSPSSPYSPPKINNYFILFNLKKKLKKLNNAN